MAVLRKNGVARASRLRERATGSIGMEADTTLFKVQRFLPPGNRGMNQKKALPFPEEPFQ